MARRSPMNERYQKHTAPAGKTRKSAAAAKPKRDTGGSKKPSASKKGGSAYLGNPDTEEYRRTRKLWWIMLGSSLLFTAASLAVQQWTPYPRVSSVLLGIGYSLIFYALYIDFFRIRKMRKEWAESQKSVSAGRKHKESPSDESQSQR